MVLPLGVPARDGVSMAAPDIKFVDTKLPLALKWQKTDEQGHAGGYTVASITKLEARDDQLWATGYFLDSDVAKEAMEQITAGVTAPSVEIVVRESTASDKEGNTITEDRVKKMAAAGEKMVTKWNSVELVGVTLVSVPNFRETHVLLGEEKASLDAEDTAIAASVIQMNTDAFPVEAFTIPEYDELTPIHVTEQGFVVGHLASWDVCHVGVKAATGQCRTAPRSQSGYAEFHQSNVVTEDGEHLRVGRLTVGGGHGPAGRGMRAAVQHYDDVATTWAYARAINGVHGIWVSGVINPRADEGMIREGMSAPHSGHWEKVAGGLELIAAHAVNTPGFPIMKQINDKTGPVGLVASAFAPRIDVQELEEAVGLVASIAEQAVTAYKESIAAQQHQEQIALVASAAEAAVAEYKAEVLLAQVRASAKARRLEKMAGAKFMFGKKKAEHDEVEDEPDEYDEDQPDEEDTETVKKEPGVKNAYKAKKY
jgi:hypothetical protein